MNELNDLMNEWMILRIKDQLQSGPVQENEMDWIELNPNGCLYCQQVLAGEKKNTDSEQWRLSGENQ